MAGTPTFADVIDNMLKPVVDVYHDALALGIATLAKIQTIEQGGDGDYGARGMPTAAASLRIGLNQACTDAQIAAALGPVLQELGVLAKSPHVAGDQDLLVSDVYLFFNEQGTLFKSRGVTHGTPTPDGNNSGNGTIYRLTVDEYGFPLESLHAESKTYECILDQHNGRQRHAELIRLYGESIGFDFLDVKGSALDTRIVSRNASQNEGDGSLLVNSSMDFGNVSGDIETMFPGWVLNTIANVAPSTEFYRGNPGTPDEDNGCLEATGDFVAEQSITDIGVVISQGSPYTVRAQVFPVAGSTGNIILKMGTHSQSFDVSLLTPDAWNEIVFDFDRELWPTRWNTDEAKVSVEGSGIAGTVRVDDTIFCAMSPADGTWSVVFGGNLPFLAGTSAIQEGDKFVMTDTVGAASTAKIQYCFWRAGWGSMPSSGAPNVTDP